VTRASVTLHDVTRAAVALVASCALWLVVSGDERGAAWVPVEMELRDGSALVVMLPDPVHAFVTGRRRDFLRLLQSPPVLRRALPSSPTGSGMAGEAPDSVRIELRPIDVVLPHGTEARVSDLRPRSLVLGRSPGPRP
jgi:hypothetical protein